MVDHRLEERIDHRRPGDGSPTEASKEGVARRGEVAKARDKAAIGGVDVVEEPLEQAC